MKKTLFIITFCAAALIFASCQSTNQVQEAADSYQDESQENSKNKKSEKNNKNDSDSDSKFSLFDPSEKYIFGETSTLFQYSPTTPLKQQEAEAVYHIKNHESGFASRYLAAYYMVFYNEYHYDQLKADYEQYLKDFENKNLKRDGKKSYEAYGKIKVTLNWGTLKKSTPNYGSCDCYVGYAFYKNSPYFALTIYPTFNEYSNVSEGASRESIMLTYYFTKSQMENLLQTTDMSKMIQKASEDVIPVEESDSY